MNQEKGNLVQLLATGDDFQEDPFNITSIERAQLIMNNPEYRAKSRIHMVSNIQNPPVYDSRKTHYGTFSSYSIKELNIFKRGTKLFDTCPALYYVDGGIEFLESFGGQATDEPSYVLMLIPPNGTVAIKYWKHINNEELKKIILF
tara:strand:+ start:940 stop:1377 length:438 start_codon:yes stop_codon:yes gene_type:complete